MSQDYSHLMGWVDHPYRHVIAAALGPPLSQAAPYLYTAPLPPQVLLHQAWVDVLGKIPDYSAQKIGDCESFGNGHGDDLGQCIEASLSGADLDYREVSTESIYALGREAGGMLGNQDGCFGSAMVKAMTTMGMLSREIVGPYDGQRAKTWGRTGLPADLKPKAKEFLLGAAALVETPDDCRASLAAGCPVAISSNQGFAMTRDADGFCRAQGSWGHCMMVCAYRTDKPGFLICNSWGSDVPDGPMVMGQPPFSFWCSEKTMAGILSQGDSFALSKAPAFARRDLPSSWTYADLA